MLGINGRSPSDANAPYALEGDGSQEITISDIAIGPKESVKVRVKTPGRKKAKVVSAKTFWMFHGQYITPGGMLLSNSDSIGDDEAETDLCPPDSPPPQD